MLLYQLKYYYNTDSNQMFYVTYFFWHVLYELFVFVSIMTIIVIKTYYDDTIKPLIFIQIYYMHYVFRYILC